MAEYRVWECQICGWIYDEAKGWPEDGIAAGTRWEDIPDDWCCPECGAAKQDFEMLALTPQRQPQETAPLSAATPAETMPATPSAAGSKAGYRIWECMVCGWVYDESKGWPEDGIAPGTRWEDIPEDWCCPQCGVGKDEFDMVLVTEAAAESEPVPAAATERGPLADTAPVVIVGTGLAGYNLAREFRKLDQTTPLLLITGDDGTYYSKPLLSASLAHGKTPQQLASASAEEMAQELNAEILVHTQVSDIDAESKILRLATESGSLSAELRYGKLVLATGAACRALPAIDGDGLARLFRINNLGDYHRFRTAMVGRRRVLLLGSGLIGCEFANDLIQAGFAVDVVDPLDWPLATLLPEAAGRDIQRTLESHGVRFHGNTRVTRLDRNGTGIRAQLDNGEYIDADIALAALGLQANTGLAEKAGLRVNRGIAVSRQLQSSNPDIFALGDCAEVDGHQLYFVAPLMACARALAKTLSGEPTSVHYGTIPVAVKTTLRPTTVCAPRPGAEGSWHIDSSADGVRAEFRGADGHLLGFALTGSAIAVRDKLTDECAALMGD